MTTALLDRPTFSTGHGPAGHGATLEDALNSALCEARTNGSTECPVCQASMAPTRAGAREAECGGCGSRLS